MEAERIAEASRYGVDASAWPCLGPILEEDVPEKYVLSDKLWSYLQAYRARHEAKGNGFGYSLFDGSSRRTRTLSARYHKDGSEALIDRGSGRRPRRLTPRECGRLQGFPPAIVERFDRSSRQPVSDTQAYRQFGNAVAVPVVRAIAHPLADLLVDDPAGARALDAADRA
jgi:DNA (cytosine-5)-methyltransferase 1